MQQAAIPGYRLSRSKRSTRVLTTLGLLGILLGLLSSVAITISKTGLAPSSVMLYYLGSEGSVTGDLDTLLIASTPRPFAELAEVTHLHLMGGSLLLFLLCHLLSVCSVTEKTRTICYLTSFISFILTFAIPWGIVYLSAFFAYLYAPSLITLLTSLLILTFIPLREMWFPLDKSSSELDC